MMYFALLDQSLMYILTHDVPAFQGYSALNFSAGEIPITTSVVMILGSVVLRTAYCMLVCRHGSLEQFLCVVEGVFSTCLSVKYVHCICSSVRKVRTCISLKCGCGAIQQWTRNITNVSITHLTYVFVKLHVDTTVHIQDNTSYIHTWYHHI